MIQLRNADCGLRLPAGRQGMTSGKGITKEKGTINKKARILFVSISLIPDSLFL